mgnify:CR=1 FL=1
MFLEGISRREVKPPLIDPKTIDIPIKKPEGYASVEDNPSARLCFSLKFCEPRDNITTNKVVFVIDVIKIRSFFITIDAEG